MVLDGSLISVSKGKKRRVRGVSRVQEHVDGRGLFCAQTKKEDKERGSTTRSHPSKKKSL